MQRVEDARKNMLETAKAAAVTEEEVPDDVPTFQEMYDQEYTALLLQLERKELALADFNIKAAELDLKYTQDAKGQAEARIKLDDLETAAKVEKLEGFANAAGAVSKLIGEETVAGKAMATAQAIIDTWAAGTATLKATAGAGPWVAIPAMTAVVATGLANVKEILKTKIPGASGDTSAAPIANVNTIYRPPIQSTRNVLTSTEEQELRESRRVYAVETDIREVGNRVRVAETEATFR